MTEALLEATPYIVAVASFLLFLNWLDSKGAL